LAGKGAKSRTGGRKLRSTGAKAKTRVGRRRQSPADLQQQLEACRQELAESRDQQTATSEVLGIISSSPGELEAVFQTMLVNATRLCHAKFGTLNLYDGEAFRRVALYNLPSAYAETRWRELGRQQGRPHPRSGHAQVVTTKQVVQIDDVRSTTPYLEGDPSAVAIADLGGARTLIIVPMLREGKLIGTITVYRQEVRPFTDKHIELVQDFAAQAVIAIENTRLLNELRESLQQQTATADVLRVISASPGELAPVFNAMLENAVSICDAKFGNLLLYDGRVYRSASRAGHNLYRPSRHRHRERAAVRRNPG
jgi:GAF domain-containing protein